MDLALTAKCKELGFDIQTDPYSERRLIMLNGVNIEDLDEPLCIGDLQEQKVIAVQCESSMESPPVMGFR